jgi:predicted transcriptional regulator
MAFMVRLSEKTCSVIKDHIVDVLYANYPLELSTYKIAVNIGRDKSLVWKMMNELKKLGLVREISRDKRGFDFVGKRRKWILKWECIQAMKKKGF